MFPGIDSNNLNKWIGIWAGFLWGDQIENIRKEIY